MIQLPSGFDLALFASDLVSIISPVTGIFWAFVVFAVIVKIGKRL